MAEKASKVTRFVDSLYIRIYASWIFWKTLLAHLVIYGWLAAVRAAWNTLTKTMPEISAASAVKARSYEKLLSFLISMGLILTIIGSYLPGSGGILTAVSGIALSIVLIPCSCFYLIISADPKLSPAEVLYWSLKAVITKVGSTACICSLLFFASLVFYLNKVLFIFFLPGLVLDLIWRILEKTSVEGVALHDHCK